MEIINRLFLLLLLCSLSVQQDVIGAAYLAPAGISASDLKIRFDSSIPADKKIELILNVLDTLPHQNIFASVIEKRLEFISQMPPNPEENNSLWLAAEDTALFLSDALFGLDTLATNIDENALLCAVNNKNRIAYQYFAFLYKYLNKSASSRDIRDAACRWINKKLKTETLDIERLDVFLTFFFFQHLSCLNMFSSPDALTWQSREKRKRVISFLLRRLYEEFVIEFPLDHSPAEEITVHTA